MANTKRKRVQRGVYQVRNLKTGLIYVGSSENLSERWRIHKWHLQYGDHPSKRMQSDYRNYGMLSFVFEILEESHQDDLYAREQIYLDLLKPYDPAVGYNTHLDAESGRGIERSEEVRRNISNGHKGLKFTKEHKANIAAANTGKVFTQERCDNISEGRKNSERARKAICTTNAAKRALTHDDVRRIRVLRQDGTQQQAIADEFGVSRRVIRAIVSRETYQEVQ